MKLGEVNRLKVARERDFGLYLTDGEEDVLLPQKYVPETVTEFIEVFLYTDSEDRIIATTLTPKLQLHECALLTIKDITKYGAFADWGLEKDLLIPFREQMGKMQKDEEHIIYLFLDERTDRLVGSAKLEKFLNKKPSFEEGESVDLLIGRKTDLGFEVVIDNTNLGLIFHNEIFQPLKMGDRIPGYVKRIRPDGKIDLTLQKLGYSQIKTVEDVILEALEKNQGMLMLTDKSSPEEIAAQLRISKKNFKKGVGALYKQKRILLKEDCITSGKV